MSYIKFCIKWATIVKNMSIKVYNSFASLVFKIQRNFTFWWSKETVFCYQMIVTKKKILESNQKIFVDFFFSYNKKFVLKFLYNFINDYLNVPVPSLVRC